MKCSIQFRELFLLNVNTQAMKSGDEGGEYRAERKISIHELTDVFVVSS